MPGGDAHSWEFRRRFRRNASGWRSQTPIKRIKEAVSEITGADVREAYDRTMKAAENAGCADETHRRIRDLVSHETFGERFVTRILGPELGLS